MSTLLWKSSLLTLTALLTLINPFGSALVLLSLVGDQPIEVYRRLASKIALSVFVFLLLVQFVGSYILAFFGISLPIIQMTVGLVIASTAWRVLFEKDADAHSRGKAEEIGDSLAVAKDRFSTRVFYPFTFPITAGPGALVVMLSLTARESARSFLQKASLHGGIILAEGLIAALVYLCYGYAPRLVRIISPSTVHGVLRIIAFLLMCIGVQLVWSGLSTLARNWMTVPVGLGQ